MDDLDYQTNDLKDIIKDDKIFINEIKNYIKTFNESTLFTINISNLSVISAIYDQNFIDEILNNVVKKINDIFPEEKIIKIFFDNYIIVIFECKIQDTSIKALEIYNLLQLFGSEFPNKPYHLISYISSISFPSDTIDVVEAIEKTYNIFKTISKENDDFYYPYSSTKNSINLSKKKFILGNCLKNALIEKNLRFAFQPIIKTDTGHTMHYESLLRIINNDGKIISAGPFIQIAEEMGFINLIDDLVLDMVVNELKNNPNIHLAFNLSGKGLANSEWLNKAKRLLNDVDIASRLVVEITETAAQRDLNKSAYFISALQDLGCQVALDDFGAGYTSFRQLKALPIDIIKIDGSFIRDISENHNNLLFVKTLINMSKGFGLKSVAEFVENGEIAKTLMELKVDYMQGNYFCPAINYRDWKCTEE